MEKFSNTFPKSEYSNLNGSHCFKQFEHQHSATGGKFHTVKLCFIFSIAKNT
jgi:hypothetical protein|uniref:Uncharacterized protein n=1 Tax=Mus musculus TaxID=10090 RepID=Q3UNI0_MOUSE|nr:unnamed protein product [Mus musculus]